MVVIYWIDHPVTLYSNNWEIQIVVIWNSHELWWMSNLFQAWLWIGVGSGLSIATPMTFWNEFQEFCRWFYGRKQHILPVQYASVLNLVTVVFETVAFTERLGTCTPGDDRCFIYWPSEMLPLLAVLHLLLDLRMPSCQLVWTEIEA